MDKQAYDKIPYISQQTIECDLRAFTRWLNDMVDVINWLSNKMPKIDERLDDLEKRIECLEDRMDDIEKRMDAAEECCKDAHDQINNINRQLGDINNAINMFQDRLQWFYDHLPTVYGNVPSSWKFAMGNINVMSDNNSTPSIQGAGIFTSMAIEDNDIYFN